LDKVANKMACNGYGPNLNSGRVIRQKDCVNRYSPDLQPIKRLAEDGYG
jgi:hypothetical protein